MKKLMTLVAAALFCVSLTAAPAPKSPADRAKAEVAKFTPILSLTPEQAKQWEEIKIEHFTAVDNLKADQTLSEEDQKAKIKEVGGAAYKKIQALLTPDQKKALKEYQESQKKDAKPADGQHKGQPQAKGDDNGQHKGQGKGKAQKEE